MTFDNAFEDLRAHVGHKLVVECRDAALSIYCRNCDLPLFAVRSNIEDLPDSLPERLKRHVGHTAEVWERTQSNGVVARDILCMRCSRPIFITDKPSEDK